MVSAKNNQLISSQDVVQLKPTVKYKSREEWHLLVQVMLLTASVYSEKNHMKKLMMMMKMIIIITKSQETTVFNGRQKLTSAMKQRPEKWW